MLRVPLTRSPRFAPASTSPRRRGEVEATRDSAPTSRHLLLRILNRAPDSLRGQRHGDLCDAVFGERVEHGIDQRGEATGAAGLAAVLGAQRVGFGGRGMVA